MITDLMHGLLQLPPAQLYQVIMQIGIIVAFIVFAWFVIKSIKEITNQTAKDAQERESRLMDYIEKQTETHSRMVTALEKIEIRLSSLERMKVC